MFSFHKTATLYLFQNLLFSAPVQEQSVFTYQHVFLFWWNITNRYSMRLAACEKAGKLSGCASKIRTIWKSLGLEELELNSSPSNSSRIKCKMDLLFRIYDQSQSQTFPKSLHFQRLCLPEEKLLLDSLSVSVWTCLVLLHRMLPSYVFKFFNTLVKVIS